MFCQVPFETVKSFGTLAIPVIAGATRLVGATILIWGAMVLGSIAIAESKLAGISTDTNAAVFKNARNLVRLNTLAPPGKCSLRLAFKAESGARPSHIKKSQG